MKAPPPEDPADEIEELAAEWLVRREEGLPPEAARDFAAWERVDPRHAAPVARLHGAPCLYTHRTPGSNLRGALEVAPDPLQPNNSTRTGSIYLMSIIHDWLVQSIKKK